MNTSPIHINKILEIDFDTDRENQLEINQLQRPNRSGRRRLDQHISDHEDITMLAHALVAKILWAEEKGTFKKGECMQQIMDSLGLLYGEGSATLVRSESVMDVIVLSGTKHKKRPAQD